MEMEEYLRKVTKYVDDSSVREGIRDELRDHIEDLMSEYMEMGMEKEEAERRAVQQMGNPIDTGRMFNKVYPLKVEWKVAVYILVWAVILGGINLSGLMIWWLRVEEIPWLVNAIGVFFLIFGFLWSGVEKYNDFAFIYAYAKNWGRGTAIFNASAFLGIGVGLAARRITEWIYLYLIMTALTLIQRGIITEKRRKKEEQFMWETCIALEDFDYCGKVEIKGRTSKVQVQKGEKAKKGDLLTVVGIDGFRLVVGRM